MSEVFSSGIATYVNQNQKVLTADNYSTEDALIFSELSYTKFEKVYGEDYGDMTVSVKQYAEDIIQNQKDLSLEQIEFLNELRNSERYSNCTISQFAAENEKSQWAAMTVRMNDQSDSAVIAMRGTNGTTLGWTEDLELAYDVDGTEAQKLSAQYLQNSTEKHIYLAGHSKGGSDVSSAFVMVNEDIRDKVMQIDNFDGPGVNIDFKKRYVEGYAQLSDKLNNYYPQDSIIGLLLNDNPGNSFYIRSSDSEGIFWEHSLYQWQFDKNGVLQKAEQSDLSEFINDVTDNMIHTLSQSEREKLMKVLIKAGVPALIAKENIIPEDASLWETIGAGASLSLELHFGGTDVLKKTMAAMLVFSARKGTEMLLENAYQKVQAEAEKLYHIYQHTIDYLEQKRKDTANAVRQFVNNLKDGIVTVTDSIKSWFGSKIENHGLAVSFGNANFMVESKRFLHCRDQLEACRKVINQNQMQVLSIMAKLTLSADFGNACNLGRLAYQLEREENSCKRLIDLLERVEKQYRNCEQDIMSSVVS